MQGNRSGSTFSGSGFKPALLPRNVLFKTVLLNTMPRDSIQNTPELGLGQGLD
jgi:hypothetical protein